MAEQYPQLLLLAVAVSVLFSVQSVGVRIKVEGAARVSLVPWSEHSLAKAEGAAG
jgi:hypothetical protein